MKGTSGGTPSALVFAGKRGFFLRFFVFLTGKDRAFRQKTDDSPENEWES
jgi:hypothetical protein